MDSSFQSKIGKRHAVQVVLLFAVGLGFLSSLFFFTDSAAFPALADLHLRGLPPCKSMLLLSAQRHGSTWMIDVMLGCKYSRLGNGSRVNIFPREVYMRHEMWSPIGGSFMRKIPGRDAARIVARKNSLKALYPHTLNHTQEMAEMFWWIARHGAPVVILRRQLRFAYESLGQAEQQNNWWITGKDERVLNETEPKGFQEYREDVESYFGRVEKMLQSAGIRPDVLWYENVVDLPEIRLRQAKCVLKNCNFF